MKQLSERKKKQKRAQARTLSEKIKNAPRSRVYPKGRVIRVSSFIYNLLQRKLRNEESWDKLFRRIFNIPQRNGEQESLFECWLLRTTGQTFPTKALARAQSVRNGVAKGHSGKFEEPIRVREVV